MEPCDNPDDVNLATNLSVSTIAIYDLFCRNESIIFEDILGNSVAKFNQTLVRYQSKLLLLTFFSFFMLNIISYMFNLTSCRMTRYKSDNWGLYYGQRKNM